MTMKIHLIFIAAALAVANAVQGETICSGRSTSVPLDLRTGMRTTSGGVERVVYDATWFSGGATVRIDGMGGTPLTGTSGVGSWTPSFCRHHLVLEVFNGTGTRLGTETADFSYAMGTHDGVETKAARAQTCTATGWTHEVSCSRCGAVLEASTTVSALGHIEVETKAAKAPTCTADGWTHEVTCSRCGNVLESSTTLAALGHVEVETKAAKAPTCTEDGWTHEKTCSRCQAILEDSIAIPASGHSGIVTKPAVEPAGDEDGKTAEIVCTRCGEVLQPQWSYSVSDGKATVLGVDPASGALSVPDGLGGCPVIAIGDGAFASCDELTAVMIPDGVTSIEGWAFQGCQGLISVTIPNSVTNIGYYAFDGCSGLETLTIPDDVTSIGVSAFDGCNSLYDTNAVPGVRLVDGWVVGYEPSLSGPLVLSGVRGIADFAFDGCAGVTSVEISNGVKIIGDDAFRWCDELTSVSVSAHVATIGLEPFFGCPKLTSVQVAPGNPVFDSREGCNAIVRTADNVLVAGCPGSTIPDSVTAIGDGAFAACSGPSITIPSSVTSIGSEAFRESDLTSVTIPNSVTNVGDRAFKWCQELESVVIPASVTNIGEESFEGCAALTSIRVSPDNPFYDSREDCNAIIRTSDNVLLVGCCETTIPESVTGIGNCAFGECWMNLTSLVIPDGVTFIGDHAFYGCDQLVSVTIPDSVTAIGAGAFSACMSLASVTVPAGVTSIGDGAFSWCSGLAELRLPRRFENQMEGMGVPDDCNVVFYDCFRLLLTSEHGTPAPAFSSGWAPGNVSLVCRVSSPVPDSNNEDVRYVCSGWKGTGSVPATGTGTNCTFALTKDSTLAWQWNRSVRIRLSVDGGASSTFADGWCDGPGPAVIPFDAPAGLLHCTLSGDADGVTVDQAARTVSVPTDRPRSVALRVESVGGAVATDGKAVDYATGGEAPWFPVAETTCADGRCLRSGVVGAGETSVLETTVAGPGRISFRWKALCNRGDYCRFLVDGEPAASISRLASSWATVEMDLGEGEHVLGWSWEKSASAASGENGSFLDDVRWRPRVALAVFCAEGASSPAAGTTEFLYGDLVAASVSEPAPSNGVQCACTGWTGTGSVPENGTGTNVVFTVTEDSTLAWNWRTNVWLSLSCEGMVLASLSGEWAERGRTNLVFYEPLTAYHTLSLSGDTDGVVWDRDAKTLAVPADRPRDLALALETLTLSSVLDAAGLRWVTSGASGWTPEAGTAADGGNAARSGGVATGEESVLSSTLSGPGTLSWSWRLDADGVLGVDVELDGAYALSLETPGAWETGSLVVEGEGDHVVRFVFWNEDPDCTDRTECAWLDGVSWSGEVPETAVAATASTPVPVPHAWLSETAPAALSRAGGDFEAAAAATAANGRPVWQCFVAGLDPEDPEAEFRACIAISNGVPVVTFAPDLGNARRYVVEGRETLDGGDWGPTNAASRFYRVRATMPDGWTPSGTTPDGFPGVVTLTLDANGGTVAESSRIYDAPGTVGELPEAIRFGGGLEGWWSRREGGVRFDDSMRLPWTDFTLFAHWTPIDHLVRFDANGGTGEMEDVAYNCEMTDACLPACSFAKPGNRFSGWATEPDGEAVYADGEPVSKLAAEPGKTEKTLHAVWLVNQYTISFESNGGGSVSAITQDYGTAVTAPVDPTRTGYTFSGWSPSVPATMPAADTDCVAQWTPINYTAHFHANGGSGEMADFVYNYEMGAADHGLSVRYYDISSSGYSTWTQSEAAMTNYFASCTPTIVTNTLDWGETLQSGFQENNMTEIWQNYPGLWLDHVSTNRYHGKYANKSQDRFAMLFTGELIVNAEGAYGFAMSCDNSMILYIDGTCVCSFRWPIINGQPYSTSSTISLSPGRHRVAMATYEDTGSQGVFVEWKQPGETEWSPLPQSVLFHGTAARIPSCAFTRTGHSFAGWATEPNGDVVYADGEIVNRVFTNNNETAKDLYAVWTVNQYTVTFDSAGGSAVPSVTAAYGSTLTAPAIPTRDGWTFAGWSPSFPATMPLGGATLTAQWTKAYLVVDLSGGANASTYSVTYLAEPPEGGFNTDEYKTTKLVLRRLEPGPVPTHDATITKPFYVGLFEVTQKQWSLVMGSNPSCSSGDKRPVESVTYNAIRGSSLGSQWPASNAVDADSFLGKLRARTGIDFDLPTEAQWEYACRAGTMTTYSYGDSADGNYMWYWDNSSSQTHEVGTKLPNPWGLYDMHGNVWERCLDWTGGSLSGNDPVGSSSGSYRVACGGSWSYGADGCTSSYRIGSVPSLRNDDCGFRLVRTLSN